MVIRKQNGSWQNGYPSTRERRELWPRRGRKILVTWVTWFIRSTWIDMDMSNERSKKSPWKSSQLPCSKSKLSKGKNGFKMDSMERIRVCAVKAQNPVPDFHAKNGGSRTILLKCHTKFTPKCAARSQLSHQFWNKCITQNGGFLKWGYP